MGLGAVVVDRVARLQDFGVAVEGDLELAGEDVVVFLALVVAELDGAGHLLERALGADDEGFGDLVLEEGGEVVVAEALAARNGESAAGAGNAVGLEGRARSLEQVGRVDAETGRALVNEREGEVGLSGLEFAVGLKRDAGALRHLLLGDFAYESRFAYAVRDILDHVFHGVSLPM